MISRIPPHHDGGFWGGSGGAAGAPVSLACRGAAGRIADTFPPPQLDRDNPPGRGSRAAPQYRRRVIQEKVLATAPAVHLPCTSRAPPMHLPLRGNPAGT